MERLDKIIAGTGKYSRREVKELVRQGRVVVDGRLASSPEEKVDADAACLLVDGQSLDCRRYTYLMLHKPAGVLSARVDGRPIPFSFKASRNSSSSTRRPAVSMARKSVASV